MELHSYAKRRTTKKWSIEQKRQLVESRIAYDALFEHEPNSSVAPWKKVMSIAKLEEYNVFFLRKQWGNMIEKYKQYKQNKLGNTPTRAIDNEMLDKLKQEWEFFDPIHRFMTRKTTNLHSYALTSEPPAEDAHVLASIEPNAQQIGLNSSIECINEFSSDTYDDYAAAMGIKNDHDFYSKKTSVADDKQKQYFADASEDTRESMLMELATTVEETVGDEIQEDFKELHEVNETKVFATFLQQIPEQISETILQQQNPVKEEPLDEHDDVSMPHFEAQMTLPTIAPHPTARTNNNKNESKARKRLSERDKYYRHKRRFNRRLEQRYDAILNVLGQIVVAEYPSVDVSGLLSGRHGNNAQKTSFPAMSGLMDNFLTSNEEETSDDYGDENDANV